MGRSSRRRSSEGQRDDISTSLDPDGLLSEVEDLRTYTPAPTISPAFSVSGVPAQIRDRDLYSIADVYDRTQEFMEYPERLISTPQRAWSSLSSHLGFDVPQRAIRCVRRKIRREVMFSLPRRKRRGGAGARRRRNEWSDVHC